MKFLNGKYIAFLLLFLTACHSDTLTTFVDEWEYLCNAELTNEKGTFLLDSINPLIHYKNINTRTTDDAHSGKYSIKLCGEKKYGFTIELSNLKKNEFIVVTAWRKSKDEKGVIVASTGNFYKTSNKVIATNTNGWEKIYFEFFLPTNITENLKIYVWNNGSDTIFFDDFRISKKNNKIYPEYDIESAFKLYYDEKAKQKIENIRFDAFEKGMLIVDDDDYVNSIIFSNDDFFEAKIRLKGDWLDHIQGDKLSFRIRPKTGNAWRGMTEFSIQNPETRNFQNEWVLHQMLLNNDLLTTRYGFIPAYVNSISKGIFAWEEHFDKQLIESSNRREGPIVRYNESLVWERVRLNELEKKAFEIPFYESSTISPFKQNNIIEDPLLKNEFIEAQSLMHQIQFRKSEVSEVFDIESLAAYFAYNLLNQTYHGMAWHNIRYYYNPVLCRLEPITYDGDYNEKFEFTDSLYFGQIKNFEGKHIASSNVLDYFPLRDTRYMNSFYNLLNKITSDTFLIRQFSLINDQLKCDEQLIKKEFTTYYYHNEHIWNKAEQFRSWLPDLNKLISDPDFYKSTRNIQFKPIILSGVYYEELIKYQVHVFKNEDSKGIPCLEIENFFGDTIKIIMGKPIGEPFVTTFDQPIVVAPINAPYLASSFKVNRNFEEVTVEIPSAQKTIVVPVIPWPAPKALSSRQEVERMANFPQTGYYSINDDKIEFSGKIHIDSHLIIPSGYTVIFKPGTQIDITDSATFVSYSPVYFRGTKKMPVEVKSTDGTAKGFNILQARGRSEVNYTTFDGISNLAFGGWFTPSAVCFYESDVDLNWATFKNNSNCDDALNIVRSNFYADHCHFENTFADAFDSDFCTGTVTNCTFENPGNDAIDFSGSKISISNCTINNPGDKGVSGGENSQLVVTNTTVTGANIGIASKDLSTVTLKDCKVESCAYGLAAYVKKPEYGPATIITDNCDFRKNILLHLIEEGSVLQFNNREIYGTARKVAERFY